MLYSGKCCTNMINLRYLFIYTHKMISSYYVLLRLLTQPANRHTGGSLGVYEKIQSLENMLTTVSPVERINVYGKK